MCRWWRSSDKIKRPDQALSDGPGDQPALIADARLAVEEAELTPDGVATLLLQGGNLGGVVPAAEELDQLAFPGAEVSFLRMA